MVLLTETPEVVAPSGKYIWTVIGSMLVYMMATIKKMPTPIDRSYVQMIAIGCFVAHSLEALYVLRKAFKVDVVKPAHCFWWSLQTFMWGFPSMLKFNKEFAELNGEVLKKRKQIADKKRAE
eukprot:GDKJ01021404.1.p1 GENE.GDKJ01021404.1~~GDKJ01021404.1.p1  ORF type:complete len:122 (-),score=26.50 GDKJ01021404.1:183-548(-)